MTASPLRTTLDRQQGTLRPRGRLIVFLPLCVLLLAGFLPTGPASGVPPAPLAAGAAAPPGQATAGPGQMGQPFPETGFSLGSPVTDPFAEYFHARGGILALGYPTSRPMILLGSRVQFFQRHVMQQQPNGRVALLNLLDEGMLPYTVFGDATVPPFNPALAAAAPSPGTADYGQAVSTFIAEQVPDTWSGQPVGFLDAFLRPARSAGETDATAQTLVGLELLGFPTSEPAPDPHNSSFVYQRFQRGVLHFDATTGQTQPLLLADYLKAVMIGRDLPDTLRMQVAGSRFFRQYNPSRPRWLTRPLELPDTDLTQAFEREDQPSAGPVPGVLPTSEPFSGPPGQPGQLFPTPSLAPTPFSSRTQGPTPSSVSLQPTPTPTRNPEPPFIAGTEPGSVAVGQDIIIRGRNLGDQAGHVIFTGKLATAQVWSDTNIIVTVPQGAFDGVVRVRRADGVISNSVGFAPATSPTPSATQSTPTVTATSTTSPTLTPSPTPSRPSINSVEPYYGPPSSSVLIRGSGFGTTTGSVLFGNYSASVALWSDTSILVFVPTQLETRTVRIFVVRTDGAVSEPPRCFVVTPATPTPAAPTPTAPPGC